MKSLFAHSAKDNCPPQDYEQHIKAVTSRAEKNAINVLHFRKNKKIPFVEIIKLAAVFHDLGKLDEKNQEVLSGRRKARHLPVNHVDAGVAYLKRNNQIEAAFLAYAHHIGLQYPRAEEIKKGHDYFRNMDVKGVVDARIGGYLEKHQNCLSDTPTFVPTEKRGMKAFDRRLALSCLVDADHGNTAEHYHKEVEYSISPLRWKERIAQLDAYIQRLPVSERSGERNLIYRDCQNADIIDPIRTCDSPVGTGKTTSVMAHLLKVAEAKQLRHIMVVLPFTNIIKQSVETYRKALVLAGENKENIVAEHHHQAEFSDLESRHLATLWSAPIIVTTAIQFFETLASNHPSRLRKLHELPGTAVFIDEVQSAIPADFWPVTWKWLEHLAEEWGCYFVLGSGTLPKFWENENVIKPSGTDLKDLLNTKTYQKALGTEKKRIKYYSYKEAFNKESLADFIISKPGPRLVIMNTVQSAGVMADYFTTTRKYKPSQTVFHLSTALTPNDRNDVVDKIKKRFDDKDNNWIVVATSCIEAGMDFSFNVAFRESCSTASLIQTGGRVNRHGGGTIVGEIWDFRVQDALLNDNPQFRRSAKVLADLFGGGYFDRLSPSELVTEAMKWEVKTSEKTGELMKAENDANYPEIAKLYQVIDAPTKLVVIDHELIAALKNRRKVDPIDLVKGSVQMRSYYIEKLGLQSVPGYEAIYEWEYKYDPLFLGYMAGILPIIYLENTGFSVI
jgi:CRISPR-associated endonuclease/helicase Cas3